MGDASSPRSHSGSSNTFRSVPGAGRNVVTVVIPTHDRRRLVLRALDSVLRQRDIAPEIVVVDDGGTDGTAEALRDLHLPQVRVIRHPRSTGVSGARNAGLAEVSTPWVAFLDDDDVWAPDKLRSQFRSLDQMPDASWSCVGAMHVDRDLRVQSYSPAPPSGHIRNELLRHPAIPGGGSGVLVDTEAARRGGGFDEGLSILADWDFYLRLSAHSPIASVDEPLLAYCVHPDSMYHDPTGVVREISYLRHKHCSAPDGGSFAPDLAHWHVRLARMAHQLGDRRTAVRLLRAGMAEVGILPVGRQLLRRLARKAQRNAPDSSAVAHSSQTWLSTYDQWMPSEKAPRDQRDRLT
jgi:glycosyltransferase involved in cell wall biosynthesis